MDIWTELREQKEQAARDKQEFTKLIATMQASLDKLVTKPSQAQGRTVLEDLPSSSAAQRVARWNVLTREDRQHVPSVSADSIVSESLIQNIGTEEDTGMARQLAEGQSHFDWDHDGTKWSTREDIPQDVKDQLSALESLAKQMAMLNRFPQEPVEVPVQSRRLGAYTQTSSVSEVTISLPDNIKDVYKDARKYRATKISVLPRTVRKGYRVPREDWAFLGAVRRPDKILEAYNKTKKNAKGIHQLQDTNQAALASAYQDAVQFTAHTTRPVSAAYQSAVTIHDLALKTQEMNYSQGASARISENLQKKAILAQYNLTASADAADCLARQNADAARCLRAVWLESSRLPEEVRDAVKTSPIVEGVMPPDRGMEFTTAIAGDIFKTAHDNACSRAKADKLLAHKSSVFQRSYQQPQKRKSTTGQIPTSWKRQRHSPPRSSQAARPSQQRQNRGHRGS